LQQDGPDILLDILLLAVRISLGFNRYLNLPSRDIVPVPVQVGFEDLEGPAPNPRRAGLLPVPPTRQLKTVISFNRRPISLPIEL
jgi:hypothetical protein